MITFTVALVLLVLGYFIYGAIVERVFGPDSKRVTPCYTHHDGVDYMPMATWRVFLIQFLNIAGTGPIFGAIMGILFGPAAYLWIVFGCIFAGAVHDYLSGMISLRKNGASLPELIGDELGTPMRHIMRVISMVLMILVGAVFVITPADLLHSLASGWSFSSPTFWGAVIFIYYILATILPIDAVIGRIYPVFGFALLFMAVGVGSGVFIQDGWMPEITDQFVGNHPKGLAMFPMLCITIACGAISGFHATQSPMMARCLRNERLARPVFYGAMITEGIVALIWAGAAIKFAGSYEALANMGTPAVVVNEICSTWLGKFGMVLAVLGVVAAPITSGDTALRAARLIVADMTHLKQNSIKSRLLLAVPIFALVIVLFLVDFDILWRYFAWINQTIAMITLWGITVYLRRHSKFFWISLVPAMFMTVVTVSYIMVAPEGFSLPYAVGIITGIVAMVAAAVWFFLHKLKKADDVEENAPEEATK